MVRIAVVIALTVVAVGAARWIAKAPRVDAPAVRVSDAHPAAAVVDTAASALAVARPSSVAVVPRLAQTDESRCGRDEMPVFKDPEPDADGVVHLQMPVPDPDGVVRRLPGEIKPAGVGYTGAQRRIDAALRATGDPFDRSVADWLNVDGLRSPSALLGALAQDALDSGDARAYALAFHACNDEMVFVRASSRPTSPACASLSVAEWARRDPGNGVPWVYALRAAMQDGDAAAQAQALRQIASSSRFDERAMAGPAAVARLQMPDADLAAQTALAMQAFGMPTAPPFSVLTRRCRDRAGGDDDLAHGCDEVARVLFDLSDSLIVRAIGGSLHKLATGDPGWLEKSHRERAALEALPQPASVSVSTPCGAERAALRYFVRAGEIGEVAALKERTAASAPL
jgi:hypothetical protein